MPQASAPATQYVQRPIDNLMRKKDVAAYLKVSLRTVDNLKRKGYLPYIRLGSRCVRFMLADVQNEMTRRSTVGR
jgi:excisionase family DNA binding protein